MKTIKTLHAIRNTFFFCLVLIFACSANAQDKITLTNGKEMNVKVVEITPNEIKFKREDNIDGPTNVVSKSNILAVEYANGTVDVFASKQNTKTPIPVTDSYGQPIQVLTDPDEFLTGKAKKFSGPRLGLAFITNGTMSQNLVEKGKNPMITLMGWQFEQRIFTIDDGACGLLEFVPLIGGMEQGLFLPSANFLIGLRGGGKRSGEFAMGPNLSLTGLGMVFAAGFNFTSGKINFPVNIAVVPSVGSKQDVYDANTGATSSKRIQTGWRISLTVGFNSRKK